MKAIIEKITENIFAIYFIALGTLMHYFVEDMTFIGGIGISFRHIFALLIVFSTVIIFLVKPNISRGIVSLKSALVMSAPIVVMLTVSLLIWTVNLTETDMMMRGVSLYFIFINNTTAAFAGVCFLYLFGEKGMWYYMVSILIANLILIGDIMLDGGVVTYMIEYVIKVLSFAGDSRDVVGKAEIHELSFCTGISFLYMLFVFDRKKVLHWILLILTFFCFTSAIKRIAVLGIGFAVVLAWFFNVLKKRVSHQTIMKLIGTVNILMIILLILYVGIIKSGLFEILEEGGLETSGRAKIYASVSDFYEFSPSFFGRGMGWLPYQLSEVMDIGVKSVHNDFLQFYIDLGFWGYIIWLLSFIVLRTSFFGRDGDTNNAVLMFLVTVFMVVVSLTDNTMNYPLFNGAVAIFVTGYSFEQKVRADEMKRFSYISEENKERSGK